GMDPPEAEHKPSAAHDPRSQCDQTHFPLQCQSVPHVDTAEHHQDQTYRDRIHRQCPHSRQDPVALVSGIPHAHACKRMQHTHDAPAIELGAFDVHVILLQIRPNLPTLSWPRGTKIQTVRIGTGGGPLDFTLNAELPHEVDGLLAVIALRLVLYPAFEGRY